MCSATVAHAQVIGLSGTPAHNVASQPTIVTMPCSGNHARTLHAFSRTGVCSYTTTVTNAWGYLSTAPKAMAEQARAAASAMAKSHYSLMRRRRSCQLRTPMGMVRDSRRPTARWGRGMPGKAALQHAAAASSSKPGRCCSTPWASAAAHALNWCATVHATRGHVRGLSCMPRLQSGRPCPLHRIVRTWGATRHWETLCTMVGSARAPAPTTVTCAAAIVVITSARNESAVPCVVVPRGPKCARTFRA